MDAGISVHALMQKMMQVSKLTSIDASGAVGPRVATNKREKDSEPQAVMREGRQLSSLGGGT